MKTIFTLLTLFTFGSAFAWNDARLSITVASLRNSGNAQLQVDNRTYTLTNGAVQFDNMTIGQHTIRLLRRDRNGNGYGTRNTVVLTYTVNLRPATHTDLLINRFGRVFVDERAIANGYDNDPWGGGSNGNTGWNGASNGGWYDNGSSGNNPGNGGYGNGGYNNGGYDNGGYNNGPQAMSSSDFDLLVAQLRRESFDNTKVTVAKDALAANYVNVAQVKQLVQTLRFDTDRLELAKAAYPRTVDKNNYFQVGSEFQFSNTKEELSNWVRTQR